MKKYLLILNNVSALALLAGLVGRLFDPLFSAVYLCSAVIFALTQFLLRPRYESLVMRRLVSHQQVAGLFLVAAGVLMYTHHGNEWIPILFSGAVIELYSVFRLSREIEKLEKNKK